MQHTLIFGGISHPIGNQGCILDYQATNHGNNGVHGTLVTVQNVMGRLQVVVVPYRNQRLRTRQGPCAKDKMGRKVGK